MIPAAPPPIWPAALHRVAAERDSARKVAVRLEQENAALLAAARDLCADLTRMNVDRAIDLDEWPAAMALIRVCNRLAVTL